jgi:hypothetical protein
MRLVKRVALLRSSMKRTFRADVPSAMDNQQFVVAARGRASTERNRSITTQSILFMSILYYFAKCNVSILL